MRLVSKLTRAGKYEFPFWLNEKITINGFYLSLFDVLYSPDAGLSENVEFHVEFQKGEFYQIWHGTYFELILLKVWEIFI